MQLQCDPRQPPTISSRDWEGTPPVPTEPEAPTRYPFRFVLSLSVLCPRARGPRSPSTSVALCPVPLWHSGRGDRRHGSRDAEGQNNGGGCSPCTMTSVEHSPPPPPPRVTFRRVVVPLRGLGRSPVLPFACCVGSLRSVGRCVLSAAAAGALAGVVSAFAEPSSWCVGAVLNVAGCAVCAQ